MKELKNKWIQALKTGKFENGEYFNKAKGYYRDGLTGYCALGVLGRIVDPKAETNQEIADAAKYGLQKLAIRTNIVDVKSAIAEANDHNDGFEAAIVTIRDVFPD